MRWHSCLLFFILFSTVPSWGALNKTYPTAATTQLRWDAYVDAFVQIASQPAAGPFQVARPFKPPQVPPNLPSQIQWLYVTGSSTTVLWMLPDSNETITGWTAFLSPDTTGYVITPSTFSMFEFIKDVRDNTKGEDINIIADQMEEYMIWPGTDVAHMYIQGSTTTINPLMWPPVGGWKGWCMMIINGKEVPTTCPPQ